MQGNWYVLREVLHSWGETGEIDIYDFIDYSTTYDAENALR